MLKVFYEVYNKKSVHLNSPSEVRNTAYFSKKKNGFECDMKLFLKLGIIVLKFEIIKIWKITKMGYETNV